MIPNNHTNWARPAVSLPFFHSEYRCHLRIGCKNNCGLSFAACSLGRRSSFMFFILSDTKSKEPLGLISTNVRTSLFQSFSSSFIQLLEENHKSQLEMNS